MNLSKPIDIYSTKSELYGNFKKLGAQGEMQNMTDMFLGFFLHIFGKSQNPLKN